MQFMNLDTNAIYNQLSKIEVQLERQNTYNRDYIDHKMIECDHARDQLDKINTQVTHELTNLEIHFSILEEEFNNKKRNELTNNSEILNKYNTGKERELAVELLLSSELTEINKFSRKILALKNLSGVIKAKQSIMTSKLRNIQDQFRMMCEYLKANVGSALPAENDPTVQRMANIYGELDKLAEASNEFNSEDVETVEVENTEEETKEQGSDIEDNSVQEATKTPDENDAVEIDSSEIVIDDSATVFKSETNNDASADVDLSGLDLGDTSDKQAESSVAEETVSDVSNSEDSSSEEESSDLDMDSVLDGIEIDPTEKSSKTVSSDEGDESTTLEDILTSKDAEVKNLHISGDKSKKVVEDSASTSSEVDINSILDDLSNM